MGPSLNKSRRVLSSYNSGSPQTSGIGKQRSSLGLQGARKSMHRDEEYITSTNFDSQNDMYTIPSERPAPMSPLITIFSTE